MTPERAARLVARWVRLYTRRLPPPVASRRIDEIDADVHDHIAHERAHGTAERRIALGIAGRMLRGLAADASWREQVLAGRSTGRSVTRSALRVGLVTLVVLLVPLIGMQVSNGVDWTAADFILAGALLLGSGTLLELAAKRPRSVGYRIAAAAVGIGAVLLGETDDAPGLVLFGGLLVVGAIVLEIRTAQRSE